MIPMAIAIVGFVIGAASLNVGARYFAMVLMIAGGHGSNAVVIAWVAKTMIRPRIKRAAAVAFVNACGNLAQVSCTRERAQMWQMWDYGLNLIVHRCGPRTCTRALRHAMSSL